MFFSNNARVALGSSIKLEYSDATVGTDRFKE